MKALLGMVLFVLVACTPEAAFPEAPSVQSMVSSTVVLELDSGRVFCSGVAIAPDIVLTAAHCSSLGPTFVRQEGGLPHLARMIWEDDNKDLMLLVVEGIELTFASVGDSDLVRRGDLVFEVGAPYGLMEFSFAVGYVAHVNRTLEDFPGARFMQIYVESRGGNSGGPIFNAAGEVVAIVSRGDQGGITLAVPVNDAELGKR